MKNFSFCCQTFSMTASKCWDLYWALTAALHPSFWVKQSADWHQCHRSVRADTSRETPTALCATHINSQRVSTEQDSKPQHKQTDRQTDRQTGWSGRSGSWLSDLAGYSSGMGSSRTGLDLEDSSRTKFCGLGLEDSWPWPWPQIPLALALASTMHGLGFEICWQDVEFMSMVNK